MHAIILLGCKYGAESIIFITLVQFGYFLTEISVVSMCVTCAIPSAANQSHDTYMSSPYVAWSDDVN